MSGPNASKLRSRLGLAALLAVTLALDQWTKFLARAHFGYPDGEPDYFKVKHVIGEWLQFRLIYNTGAAFGMKPQQFLPFLNPTVFYVLFSTVAIGFLLFLYRKLPREDLWQKSGITLILSGAFGNLIDRIQFQKVTDFIDVGIPGYRLALAHLQHRGQLRLRRRGHDPRFLVDSRASRMPRTTPRPSRTPRSDRSRLSRSELRPCP